MPPLSQFSPPLRSFTRIRAHADGPRAIVEGAIQLPALPVCHVTMRTDRERLFQSEAGREALFRYVRDALFEDALAELPLN